jgi:hypothetical protein
MGRELDEGSFLSDEIVKETHSTTDDGEGTSVLGDSLDVEGVTFLSSSGSRSERNSGGGEVGNGLSKIDFSLIPGLGAGGEMVGGHSEGSLTFSDFTVSECLLFFARSVVSSEHGIVLSLLSSDLVFKFVEESFDVGKWATSLDLSFDLSKQVTERVALEGVKLAAVHLERPGGSDKG